MEVNRILQNLQSIVKKLSVSQSDTNVNVSQEENFSEFHHEEMWWDDDYVSLSMSVSQDFNNNFNNISECTSEMGDDILQHFELFPNASDEENELSIADRVKLRKLAQNQTSSASFPESQEPKLAMNCDPFIVKMTSFIKTSSPGHVFDVKKSKKRKAKKAAKMVHPVLLSLWNNVGDLFTPKVHVPKNSASNVPVVDWHKVNSRFIANVPAPSPQPLYGCSEDPEFYEHKTGRRCQPSGAVTWEIQWSKFKTSTTPFGTKPGFLTDAGVITPDSNHQLVHGYIWSPSCQQYILHASFPGELERSEVSNRRRKKKKRGSR